MRATTKLEPWWQTAVFYQVYPRSFASSTQSAAGDLAGITSRLDYLAWLGVDAVWVSPFFRSPMADFGYDVSDYCDVDPMFGTLADFDALVAAAHARGIKVVIDWVASHTSDQHAWFQAALRDPQSVERGFYHFATSTKDGEPPNNWSCAFAPGTPAWSPVDRQAGNAADAPANTLYYLHSFLPQQPDLNWHHPVLVERMHATLRFWLDRGVDGFRADVVHNLCKDATLADVDDHLSSVPHMLLNNQPETHARLRDIRKLLDSYDGDRAMVGEIFLLDGAQVASFYGDHNDELHMAFNFMPLYAPWDADAWKNCIRDVQGNHEPRNAWPTWVLSNHDQRRHRSRYGGGEAEARAAAVLLLSLQGTPFVYQGEELGLLDADVPPEVAVDPGGRDGSRVPIPWTPAEGHGWSKPAWLPFAPESTTRNVSAMRDNQDSILHLYRALLALRRSTPALRTGVMQLIDSDDSVLAFTRALNGERILVLVNFSGAPRAHSTAVGTTVLAASDNAITPGNLFDGTLRPHQACILRV